MGGDNSPENLATVTIEEHAELHFALYLEHGHIKDLMAAYGLAGLVDKADIVDAIKRSPEQRRKISEAKKGKPAHNKGKKMSDTTKLRMSRAASKRTGIVQHSKEITVNGTTYPSVTAAHKATGMARTTLRKYL